MTAVAGLALWFWHAAAATGAQDAPATVPATAPATAAAERVIQRVLALGDGEIDYARVELELAAAFDRTVNVKAHLLTIDGMAKTLAEQFHPKLSAPPGTREKLGIMAQYVFGTERFQVVPDETPGAPALLHEALQQRGGMCQPLAVLYVSLGRRVGLPMRLVPAHRHTFVQYADGKETYDIELTARGRIVPQGYHRKKLGKCDVAFYLRPVPTTQGVALIFSQVGGWLHRRRRCREGLLCADASLRRRPEQPMALAGKAACLGGLGRNLESIACADKAIALYPSYPAAWRNRGAALANLKRFGESLASYGKAIEIDPTFAPARVGRGTAYHRMKKYRLAIADYYYVLQKIDKSNALAWLFAARALGELGDYRKALLCARQATQLEPRRPLNWLWRGWMACQVKEDAEARQCLQQLRAIGPPRFVRALEGKIASPSSWPKTPDGLKPAAAGGDRSDRGSSVTPRGRDGRPAKDAH